MKKIILSIILMATFVSAQAMTDGATKEMNLKYTYYALTPEAQSQIIYLWYQKEVTIEGRNYLQYDGILGNGNHIDAMALLRQDGMKYFFYDTKSRKEYPLFDFGLQKDNTYIDVYNNIEYKVSDVRDTLISNERLRLIDLNSVGNERQHETWLESVGSIYTGILSAKDYHKDTFLLFTGQHLFYPNNQCIKAAYMSFIKLKWDGKRETEEDEAAYDAWLNAPSNLNAEFVGDTLHVWGRANVSCRIQPYAMCELNNNQICFDIYSSGGVDCHLNYEIETRIPGFPIGVYQVSLYNKILNLECKGPYYPITYTAGQMATIVLPTEPDASKGKYYRLDRVEGNEIVFEQELQPRAHVPYIIVPGEDFSIDLSTLELEGLRCDTVSIEGISFIGSYVSKEVEQQEGFYIEIIDTTPDCSLSASGETGREVLTIGALRAWLEFHWDDPYHSGGTKAPAEKMEIVLHDNGTGIAGNNFINSQFHNSTIFNLAGQRLSKPQRGMNIIGGRRLMIK